MNTAPIDRYASAEISTLRGDSAGVRIFLVISVALFLGLLFRASRHESRRFATLRDEPPPAAVE